MGESEHSEQLPPEPDFAGDVKQSIDARGSLSDTLSAQVSASRDITREEFMGHDPATCWWCKNESEEYCAEMKKSMIGDGGSSKLRVRFEGDKISFVPRAS